MASMDAAEALVNVNCGPCSPKRMAICAAAMLGSIWIMALRSTAA